MVADYLDVYTYHNYDGYGLDANLTNEIVTPQFLDKTYENVKGVLEAFNKFADSDKTELWLGEAAAAWHSGQVEPSSKCKSFFKLKNTESLNNGKQENCTNSFVSSFWYSDALGRLASLNHTGFCRQTLIGGAYGLLTRDGYEPNPDYYAAKLFHDLVGDVMLRVANISNDYGGYFRAYAYCSRLSSGHFGVLLINISPTETVETKLSVFDANDDGSVESLKVYELTSDGGLNSRFMRLNGKKLQMENDNELPCLAKCPENVQGDTLTVKPYSIVHVDVEPKDVNNICK